MKCKGTVGKIWVERRGKGFLGTSNHTTGPSFVCSHMAGMVLHFFVDVRKFVKVRECVPITEREGGRT